MTLAQIRAELHPHHYWKLTTVPSGFAIMAVFREPRSVNLYSTFPPRVTFIPLT